MSSLYCFFKGMFSKGLMDGRGVFTHADGLKYEVSYYNDNISVVLKTVVAFLPHVQHMYIFEHVDSTCCESDPTGRICVQCAHGPGHLHLAGWQHL